MPKNNKTASRPEVDPPSVNNSISRSITKGEAEARPPIPKELHDLLGYLEGGYGDDEGRFDATYLWPWRNLPFPRRNLNERILRIVLKRLLAPKASLERHWVRLDADILEHRRQRRASGKLARANAADIAMNAVVDALLPLREVSGKEMTAVMHNASRAAADFSAAWPRRGAGPSRRWRRHPRGFARGRMKYPG